MIVIQRRASQQHPMRVIRRRRHWRQSRLIDRPTRMRLEAAQKCPVHVEGLDVVPIAPHGEDRRVLVHAQRSHRVGRGLDLPDRFVHAEVPEADLAVAGAGNEFAHAASLHVHVRDPLFVFAPELDHRHGGFEALVEDPDAAVAEAGDEDLSSDLVGRE